MTAISVAIVGSRDYPKLDCVRAVVSRFGKNTTVVSGGAMGVDSMAEVTADLWELKTKVFKPDWEGLGKKAGYVRNLDIVHNSDLVLAFWDGLSRGTAHSINIARFDHKPCVVIGPTGSVVTTYNLSCLQSHVVAELTQQTGVSLLDWLNGVLAH